MSPVLAEGGGCEQKFYQCFGFMQCTKLRRCVATVLLIEFPIAAPPTSIAAEFGETMIR